MAGALNVDGTLAARWSLGFEELALLNAKPAGTRLALAAQLLMYRVAGRFARAASEFADAAIAYLAEQVGAAVADLADYDWLGRSGRRHRAEVGGPVAAEPKVRFSPQPPWSAAFKEGW